MRTKTHKDCTGSFKNQMERETERAYPSQEDRWALIDEVTMT